MLLEPSASHNVLVPPLIYTEVQGYAGAAMGRLVRMREIRVFTEVIDKEGDTWRMGLEGSVLTN
jgi:hypothetical protein